MQADSKFLILTKEANAQLRAMSEKIEAGHSINHEEVSELRLSLLYTKIIRDRSIVNLLRDGKTVEGINDMFGLFGPSPELFEKLQDFAKLQDEENT